MSRRSILIAVITAATISSCIPVELAVNRALGAKLEIYVACTDSSDNGSTLHWIFENATSTRKIEPLLTVRVDTHSRLYGAEHELVTPMIRPGDRETIDLELEDDTCGDVKFIDIVRACNIAPMSCSRKYCEHSDSCNLVSPSGLPYASANINTATLHGMPSYLEVGVGPWPSGVVGCLVAADPQIREGVLSSRPPRCGEQPKF